MVRACLPLHAIQVTRDALSRITNSASAANATARRNLPASALATRLAQEFGQPGHALANLGFVTVFVARCAKTGSDLGLLGPAPRTSTESTHQQWRVTVMESTA